MKPFPVMVANHMVKGKTPVVTKKVNYAPAGTVTKSLYQITIYEVGANDLIKISRIGTDAGVYLGEFPDGKSKVRLYAKTMPLSEVKEGLKQHSRVAVLSKAKGRSTDTGSHKFVGVTAALVNDEESTPIIKFLLKATLANKVPSDAQKTKLYKWEHVFLNGLNRQDSDWRRTGTSKLNTLAKRMIEHFKIPPDRVHITNAAGRSASKLGVCNSYYSDATAELPVFVVVNVFDSTIDTLIHEMSHTIANFVFPNRVAGHGAEFCGIYAHTLALFSVFDEAKVIESMTKAGLKVKPYKGSTKKINTDLG